MKRKLKIVFMGTPEFAVASLSGILEKGYDIVGVVTAPDKPAGRGKKPKKSAVKVFSERHGLKILQPTNLKDEKFVEEFRSLNANLGVVVAFRMLPEVIWAMPEYGTFNLHASLLPDYRGAAPIHHAIMNGEKKTGVTTFFLKHKIDTGDIIFRKEVEIGEKETTGELYYRLMNIGASLVVKTASAIEDNSLVLKRQDEFVDESTILNAAPKISKEDTKIDWRQSVREVYNKIRGLNPNPAATASLMDEGRKTRQIKIYKSDTCFDKPYLEPGSIETDGKNYLFVNCSDGKISIEELKIQDRKKVKIRDFLNGIPITNDWKFI
jgi:methionyl-tRNA formyltransferase